MENVGQTTYFRTSFYIFRSKILGGSVSFRIRIFQRSACAAFIFHLINVYVLQPKTWNEQTFGSGDHWGPKELRGDTFSFHRESRKITDGTSSAASQGRVFGAEQR